MPAIVLVLLFFIFILAIPIFEQTQIYVEVEQDKITNAWTEVNRVPVIAKLIQPSRRTGIYSIEFKISQVEPIVKDWQFTISNVPSGEHAIIWFDHAPISGTYSIEIFLKKENIIVGSYILPVSF